MGYISVANFVGLSLLLPNPGFWVIFKFSLTLLFMGHKVPNRIWCCHLANDMALAEVCGLWLLF